MEPETAAEVATTAVIFLTFRGSALTSAALQAPVTRVVPWDAGRVPPAATIKVSSVVTTGFKRELGVATGWTTVQAAQKSWALRETEAPIFSPWIIFTKTPGESTVRITEPSPEEILFGPKSLV